MKKQVFIIALVSSLVMASNVYACGGDSDVAKYVIGGPLSVFIAIILFWRFWYKRRINNKKLESTIAGLQAIFSGVFLCVAFYVFTRDLLNFDSYSTIFQLVLDPIRVFQAFGYINIIFALTYLITDIKKKQLKHNIRIIFTYLLIAFIFIYMGIVIDIMGQTLGC